VKGLRVAGASTIKQANAYLESEFLPWWNATLRVTPALPGEAHREPGPEHDLDSALSRVETRRAANGYTIRFRGQLYPIGRQAIVPGPRGGKVQLESRLDGGLVARFGKREMAWKRCQTRPRAASAPAEPEPAAAPAGEASRQAPRRRGSGWMEGFDLKKSPSAWQAARASGARPAGAPDSAWGAPSNQDSMGSAGPTAPGGCRVV